MNDTTVGKSASRHLQHFLGFANNRDVTHLIGATGKNREDIIDLIKTKSINQVDIDAGKLTGSRSTKSNATSFAQLLVTDYLDANQAATDLVTRRFKVVVT